MTKSNNVTKRRRNNYGNLPKQEIFEISGFESGLVDFDRNVAFMSIDNLENLLNLDQEQRNLEIFVNPINIKNAKKFLRRVSQ